ncbi:putative ribonuclease H-like domain-containing protein [Tanacetum coccineum]|uniref:Ribonuclease H-like domain-containing protein n=1 Tax=Tanacetum coccineum TaxID=301880 RepID=A0ABQ4XPE9_9ASTR
MQIEHTNSSNGINTISTPVSTAGPSFGTAVPSTLVNTTGPFISTANESEEQLFERFSPFKNAFTLLPVSNISLMDNTGIFGNAYDDEDLEEEVDMNNVISSYSVPDTSFTKFHKDHPEDQVIGSLKTPVQTRHMTKITEEHGLFSSVHKLRRTNHKDFQNCLFACFLSQMEPKKPVQALKDPSWVEAMQDELLQFKLLKKDERGIVVKNKARLVAQGHTQEEGIDYDEVFAPIEEEVLNRSDGIFISQDKYIVEILKKFYFASVKTASTPMETNKALIKDEEAEDVDVHLYRSMIGSLMYLTASRPDIMFAVCACARFQVTPKTSHFNAVKRVFRYFKGQPKLGLWYPRDSPFNLETFSDSDYAGASKSKEVGIQRYPCLVVPLKKVGDEAVHKELGDRMERVATTASSLEAEQDSGSGLRCQDTILGDVDFQTRFETTSKQSNDPPLSKVNTFGSGEDRKDFSGRITPLFDTMMVQASEEVGKSSDHPTDSNQIPIVDQPSTSSQPKQKQKSKRKQRKEAEVAHDEIEHEESVTTPSNDPLPSDEDSMQLNDLMVLCTKLQKQVLDMEKAKSDQAIKIASFKKRVDKLEKRGKFRTTGLKRLKKVGAARRIESSNDSLGAQEDASKQGRRIKDTDADAKVTLVNETQERQDEDLMFDIGVLDDDEVFVDVTTVEKEEHSTKTGEAVTTVGVEESVALTIPITVGVQDSVSPKIPTIVEETLAQTLTEIKAAKPKAKGIVFHDLEKQVSKPIVSVTQHSIKDKGKGIMQDLERPLTKKDQVVLDEDLARNIQAQLDAEIIEEERLERKKQEEANIALIESWENIQAMMKANRLLAERFQTREREELTDEEKGKLLELKNILVIKKDDVIAIDAIPLAIKPPMIIEYKLLKKGIMVHFQLIRADGSSKRYSLMISMLQDIDREDLEILWKLVKTKHGDLRPEDKHERVLWVCAAGYKDTTAAELQLLEDLLLSRG